MTSRIAVAIAFLSIQLIPEVHGAWKFSQLGQGYGTNPGISGTYQNSVVDSVDPTVNKTVLGAYAEGEGTGASEAESTNELYNEDLSESLEGVSGAAGNGTVSSAGGVSNITLNTDGTNVLEGDAKSSGVGTGDTSAYSGIGLIHRKGSLLKGLGGISNAMASGGLSSFSESNLYGIKKADGNYVGMGSASSLGEGEDTAESYAQTGLEHYNNEATGTVLGGMAYAGGTGDTSNTTATAGAEIDTETMTLGSAGGVAIFNGEAVGDSETSGVAQAGGTDGTYGVEVGALSLLNGDGDKEVEGVVEGYIGEGLVDGLGAAVQNIDGTGDAEGYNGVSISAVDLNGGHYIGSESDTSISGDTVHSVGNAGVSYNAADGGAALQGTMGNATTIDGTAAYSINSGVVVDTSDSTNVNSAAHSSSSTADGAEAVVKGETWSLATDDGGNNGGVVSEAEAYNYGGESATNTGANATYINKNGAEMELAIGTDSLATGDETKSSSTAQVDHYGDGVYSLQSESGSEATGTGSTSVQTNGYIAFPGRRRRRETRGERGIALPG